MLEHRGEFRNLPGRGKPAQRDHLNESPYLDRTGINHCETFTDNRILFESDSSTTRGGATVGSSTNRSYICILNFSRITSSRMASSRNETNNYSSRKFEQSHCICRILCSTRYSMQIMHYENIKANGNLENQNIIPSPLTISMPKREVIIPLPRILHERHIQLSKKNWNNVIRKFLLLL